MIDTAPEETLPATPHPRPPRKRLRAHGEVLRAAAGRQVEYAGWATQVADNIVAALAEAVDGEQPEWMVRASMLLSRARSDLEAAAGAFSAGLRSAPVRVSVVAEHVEALMAAHRVAVAHDEELVTAPEAALILGVGRTTVGKYMKQGRLLGIPRGAEWRLVRAEVEALRDFLHTTDGPGITLTAASRHLGLRKGRLQEMIAAGEVEPIARVPLRLDPNDVAELEARLRAERLSALDVAEAAGVSVWVVEEAIKKGELPLVTPSQLPARKRLMVPRAAADAYIAQWRAIWKDYVWASDAAHQVGMSSRRFMLMVRGGRVRHLNGGHGLRNRCYVLRADVDTLAAEVARARDDCVTTSQLAAMMGVSSSHIALEIAAGRLRPDRDPRTDWAVFPRDIAEALAAEQAARVGKRWTREQVAKRLHLTPKRVSALVAAGDLHPEAWGRSYRFDPLEVRAYAVTLQRKGRTRPGSTGGRAATMQAVVERAEVRRRVVAARLADGTADLHRRVGARLA